MDLLEEVKERVSVLKSFYYVIRITNPVTKKNVIIIEILKNISKSDYLSYELTENSEFKQRLIGPINKISLNYYKTISHNGTYKGLILPVNILVINYTYLNRGYNVAENIKNQLEIVTFKYSNIIITTNVTVYSVMDYDIQISALLSIANNGLCELKIGARNMAMINKQRINIPTITSVDSKNIKLERLNDEINELRETLNQVCCTLDSDEAYVDRLILSQQLDELIVEYMREMNK